MHLKLICNPYESKSMPYKIARVVYAETGATSLRVVEALTSMIQNCSYATGRTPMQIASDAEIFDALHKSSPRNAMLTVNADDRGFQMCVRVATRMLHGFLPDCCNGATRFHHADDMPRWATARGYIADIDGLLFYL